jgi:hypothetical protein
VDQVDQVVSVDRADPEASVDPVDPEASVDPADRVGRDDAVELAYSEWQSWPGPRPR